MLKQIDTTKARKLFARWRREADVERAVVAVLHLHGYLVMKIPNDALYKCRVPFAMPGATDLVAIGKKGDVLWVEVKKPGGKPSARQKRVHDALRERYQVVVVVDDPGFLHNFLVNKK